MTVSFTGPLHSLNIRRNGFFVLTSREVRCQADRSSGVPARRGGRGTGNDRKLALTQNRRMTWTRILMRSPSFPRSRALAVRLLDELSSRITLRAQSAPTPVAAAMTGGRYCTEKTPPPSPVRAALLPPPRCSLGPSLAPSPPYRRRSRESGSPAKGLGFSRISPLTSWAHALWCRSNC